MPKRNPKSDVEVEKDLGASNDTRDAAIEFARQNLRRPAGEMPTVYEERNGRINVEFSDGSSTAFRKFLNFFCTWNFELNFEKWPKWWDAPLDINARELPEFLREF